MPVRAVLFDFGDTLIFQAHQPDEAALYEAMAAQVRPLLKKWKTEIDAVGLLGDLYRLSKRPRASAGRGGWRSMGHSLLRGR